MTLTPFPSMRATPVFWPPPVCRNGFCQAHTRTALSVAASEKRLLPNNNNIVYALVCWNQSHSSKLSIIYLRSAIYCMLCHGMVRSLHREWLREIANISIWMFCYKINEPRWCVNNRWWLIVGFIKRCRSVELPNIQLWTQ